MSLLLQANLPFYAHNYLRPCRCKKYMYLIYQAKSQALDELRSGLNNLQDKARAEQIKGEINAILNSQRVSQRAIQLQQERYNTHSHSEEI